MAVTRARPDGDETGELDNSDDLLSDEELELTANNLAQALETRTAAGPAPEDVTARTTSPEGPPERSQAFELAKSMWGSGTRPAETRSESQGLLMDDQRVDTILERARASQRKEKPGLPQCNPDGQATLRAAKRYTTAEVRGWLAGVRKRKTMQGNPK